MPILFLFVVSVSQLGCGDSAEQDQPLDSGRADAGSFDQSDQQQSDDVAEADGDAGDLGDGTGEPDAVLYPTIGGTIRYLDRPYDEDGFLAESLEVAASYILVEIYDITTGDLLGVTETDVEGAYSLELPGAEGTLARVEVGAAVSDDHYSIHVVDRAYAMYRTTGDRILIPDTGASPIQYDLLIDLEEEAPAYNILDVAVAGLELLMVRIPEPRPVLPNLTIVWELGVPSPCGTCFTGSQIDLQGSLEDPDGYDDDIVLHELGHFVMANLSSDDSPGGSHDGTPTDPTLAYSEGFATFFSCWTRNSETYQDYLVDGWKFRGHEELPEQYHGTTTGTVEGEVSEILVTAIMWDLFDELPEEPHDTLSGSDLLVGTLFGLLGERPEQDIGPPGIDLTDFLDQARCLLDDVEPLQRIVEEVGFPFDFDLSEDCR